MSRQPFQLNPPPVYDAYYAATQEQDEGTGSHNSETDAVRAAAYDQIDRFLRNNLDDADYADYSAALDRVYGEKN